MDDPVVRAEIERIRKMPKLPDPPVIRAPTLDVGDEYHPPSLQQVSENLEKIQNFINSFEYNYSGKPFIKMNKSKVCTRT